MKILVTGSAGFIGSHLANRLVARGDEVVGLDILNDYYDVNLKLSRLKEAGFEVMDFQYNVLVSSQKHPNYRFIKLALEDHEALQALLEQERFDAVCNLAAQAGVRYSITNPRAYIDSNIVGFANLLEACRHSGVRHLVYASSSSVYGLNENMPFATSDNVDHPISLYAASKKSNELMAHTYSHLFGMPTTGLRFFTVYGPWGRPDMALFLFTKAMLEDQPILVYNNGEMVRDFTYIDDIVEGVVRVIDQPAQPNSTWQDSDPATSHAPYRIYNIGTHEKIALMHYIHILEQALGKKAMLDFLPMQPGDVPATQADIHTLFAAVNYAPQTSVEQGVTQFANWFKDFYGHTG